MARARRYREVLAAQVKDIQDGRAPACTRRGLARSSPARPAVGSRLASGRGGGPLAPKGEPSPRGCRGEAAAALSCLTRRACGCLWTIRCGRPGLARDDPPRGEPQPAATREHEGAQVRGLQPHPRLRSGGGVERMFRLWHRTNLHEQNVLPARIIVLALIGVNAEG